jgi:hypothetical protein
LPELGKKATEEEIKEHDLAQRKLDLGLEEQANNTIERIIAGYKLQEAERQNKELDVFNFFLINK